ncbi:MAG TPA: M12 family metallo-peptidase, partial [Planctomycetota bacterium]|nr:M12 family metallo-peptidase [Planctomycetota bacterium]
QGTTVGIAFVGEVCNLGGAYGLSQHLPSTTLMPLLVAHEIGHNFGAFHDPSDSDPKFIMNPVLSGATVQRFSDESKADIQAYVGKIACLSLEAPNDSTGGETTGGSGSTTTGGGGGGGGPIDPLVLVACIALALGEIKRRALATAR